MKPSRTTHSQKEKEEGVLDYDSTILAAKTNPFTASSANQGWLRLSFLFCLFLDIGQPFFGKRE